MQGASTQELLDELRQRLSASSGLARQELLDKLYALMRDQLVGLSTGQLLDLGGRCSEETDRRFDEEATLYAAPADN